MNSGSRVDVWRYASDILRDDRDIVIRAVIDQRGSRLTEDRIIDGGLPLNHLIREDVSHNPILESLEHEFSGLQLGNESLESSTSGMNLTWLG